MAIYNECKIVINLNQLVKARPCGVDLDDEHVDNIANDLRKRLTFDSVFSQVDQIIWDYAEELWYRSIRIRGSVDLLDFLSLNMVLQPLKTIEVTKEKERKEREKEFKKNFEMVELDGGSWKIDVPRRKR